MSRSLYPLLKAAENHGKESEPDHEVGDLQTALHACWSVMTDSQREEVFADLSDTLAQWYEET